MENNRFNFLLEEYKQLRSEIALAMQRMDAAERNAILASGALWAWFAANERSMQQALIVWVPMILSIMFALKAIALRHGLHRLGRYIRNIEQTIELPNNLGWETNNGMVKNGMPIRMGLWPLVFWVSVVGSNLLAALLFPHIIT